MFGAIVGDMAGSPYERINCKGEWCEIFADVATFTDDTVLTLATADHFIYGDSYSEVYRQFGRNYPHAGYGGNFRPHSYPLLNGPVIERRAEVAAVCGFNSRLVISVLPARKTTVEDECVAAGSMGFATSNIEHRTLNIEH